MNNQWWGIKIEGNCTYSWSLIDLGGEAGGSTGNNIIKGNGSFDLINESQLEIHVQYNEWDHNNVKDIDKYDIKDDDEGSGAKVIFKPFK